MCLAPQNTHILTAQTPLSKNTATFLIRIYFWETLYKTKNMNNNTNGDLFWNQLLITFYFKFLSREGILLRGLCESIKTTSLLNQLVYQTNQSIKPTSLLNQPVYQINQSIKSASLSNQPVY